jgi:hypothetical protein
MARHAETRAAQLFVSSLANMGVKSFLRPHVCFVLIITNEIYRCI